VGFQFGEGAARPFGDRGADRSFMAAVEGAAALAERTRGGLAGRGPPLLEAADPRLADRELPGHRGGPPPASTAANTRSRRSWE